ncbi:MAG: hypothetical protein C4521_10550 [Actinobacteria bacterium]|nr:MAG: hypothetical protein C4521_10550 [Actinomycetota bacterium]
MMKTPKPRKEPLLQCGESGRDRGLGGNILALRLTGCPSTFFATETEERIRRAALEGVASLFVTALLLSAALLALFYDDANPRHGYRLFHTISYGSFVQELLLPLVAALLLGQLIGAVLLLIPVIRGKLDLARFLDIAGCSMVPSVLLMIPPYLGVFLAGYFQAKIIIGGLSVSGMPIDEARSLAVTCVTFAWLLPTLFFLRIVVFSIG